MTELITACTNILTQISDTIMQMHEEDFVKPSSSLSHASVGQHVRHTVEFFICLEQGFDQGVVNYDKRTHDKIIENDKIIALATLQRIGDFIRKQIHDKKLKLEVGYNAHDENVVTIDTNYLRELTYNIEHAVHHMAIMKIGIREVAPYINIPPDFGVAVSTVRYKESVATE
jgi:hypothetical protein